MLLVEATSPHTALPNSSFPFAINCCTFAFIAFFADIFSWSVQLFILLPGTSTPSRTRLLREVTIKTTAFCDAELCSRVDRHSRFGGKKPTAFMYRVPHIQLIRAAHTTRPSRKYNSSVPHIQLICAAHKLIRDAHITHPSRTYNSSEPHIQVTRAAHKIIRAAHTTHPCRTYKSSEPHIQLVRAARTTRPGRTYNSSVQHIKLIRAAHTTHPNRT